MTAELITRLESADGPDRELDWAIAESLGWTRCQVGQVIACYAPGDPHMKAGAPRYTASIDAALTLVPDEYLLGILAELENGRWTTKLLNRREIAGLLPESGPTPALALCIAALRAQQKDINA